MSATRFSSWSIIVFGAALSLGGCSRKESAPAADMAAQADADMMMAATTLEGAVNIVALPGYIERGESDQAYDWVTGFEAQTGCRVNLQVASNTEQLLALVAEGGPQPSPPGDASWPPPGNAPFDLVNAAPGARHSAT